MSDSRGGGTPGRPFSTSSAEIVSAASAIVRKAGHEGLTMRSLAGALGVSPMTIYTYFNDRDTLLDAVARAYLESVAVPRASGAWQADLRRLAHADWARARREPRLAQLAISRAGRVQPPAWLTRGVVEILTQTGLRRHEATLALSTLATYVLGAVSRWPPSSVKGADREFKAGLDVVLSGLEAHFER